MTSWNFSAATLLAGDRQLARVLDSIRQIAIELAVKRRARTGTGHHVGEAARRTSRERLASLALRSPRVEHD